MPRLPLRMRVFIAAVIGSAAIALVLAAELTAVPTHDALATFVVLLILATAAQLRPVHLSFKMKFNAGGTATFAAAIVLGPFLAMLVAAASTYIATRATPKRPTLHNSLFNAAASSLGAGAAAVTYLALAMPALPIVAQLLPLIAAAAAKYAVQRGLVDAVIALQMRRSPFANWWEQHRRDLAQEAGLSLLGAVAAVAAQWSTWALLLFAAPMALLLLSAHEGARLREQTRAAAREIADIIDLRDPYTHGHSQRVSVNAERLACWMGLQQHQIELVREAARLHDIGKIGTDDHVLRKPGPLEPDELTEMRRHAELGYRITRRLVDFADGAELVYSHHERYDGAGYPRGLRGNELPFEVGLIAVADTYDAMTSDRPYRRALPWERVRAELVAGRGAQWHAGVVDAFIAMIEAERAVVSAPNPAAAAVSTITASP